MGLDYNDQLEIVKDLRDRDDDFVDAALKVLQNVTILTMMPNCSYFNLASPCAQFTSILLFIIFHYECLSASDIMRCM